MTETKHTPGPWSVEDPMGDEPNDDLWVVVGDESFNWRTVALVSCDFEKGPEPKPIYSPQRNANARLISAAPDMRDALEQAVLYVETLHSLMTQDGRKTPATLALLVNIRASRRALAKASGESHHD